MNLAIVKVSWCLLLLGYFVLVTANEIDNSSQSFSEDHERFRRQDIRFPDNDNDNRGETSCTTFQRERGVCLSFSRCSSVQRNYRYIRPRVCEYRSGDWIVCCPTVALPADCGRANAATMFNDIAIAMSRKKRSKVGFARPQVVGGRTAQVSSWPWMAVLAKYDRRERLQFFCGGALITSRYVLSAAHCMSENPTFVRLGEHNVHSNTDGAQPIDVGVESTVSHERYNYPSLENDIAVIRLQRDVRSTYNIQPICLPPSNLGYIEGQWAILTGWGYTSFVGDQSDTLQEVELQVLNQRDCRTRYKDVPEVALNFPNGIQDTQMCAGVAGGGKDACQGDSGGPLVIKNVTTQRYMVIGIVSAGLGCGFENFPGVYTRVARYINWILDHIQP